MPSLRRSQKPVSTVASLAAWSLAISLCTWLCCGAWAACIASPDPGIRQLQELAAADATTALRKIALQLDKPGADLHRAELYAAQAEAYGILELDDEARQAASRGLKLVPQADNFVHVSLLIAAAESIYDAAGIHESIGQIEATRVLQPRGSTPDLCLSITRGLLEHRLDREDLAIVSLTQAYRATAQAGSAEAHVLAASALSIVMRAMGDYSQALSLDQEKIDWDTAHRATLSLSVSRFMRGQILRSMKNPGAALAEFAQARALSASLNDDQGIAFADLRSCETHVEVGLLDAAGQECASAGRLFAVARAPDGVRETRALEARIALGRGHADQALVILNEVLQHDGADMPPRDLPAVFESRARANAALHDYREAFNDLHEYVRRYVAADDLERTRQTGALRARFETDREIERNATLHRELVVSQEQSLRQARQLRMNAIVVVAGVAVIALLIYFLFANVRFRKELLRLASTDGLTGLANRRHTAQRAAEAMQLANSSGSPLTIAILDLDHFKLINDRCGHAAGDAVLQEFARVSRDSLRGSDLLGRWGGEEFLLVMPRAGIEIALATLARLRSRALNITLPESGAGLRVSLSAGLALYHSDVKSLDDLIARADAALYAAKNDGRDRVRIADQPQFSDTSSARRVAR